MVAGKIAFVTGIYRKKKFFKIYIYDKYFLRDLL